MRTINLVSRNDVGIAEAKARITARVDTLRETYAKVATATMSWAGDEAHVFVKALGQQASASIAVTEETITIKVTLPWVLAGLARPIEAFLRGNADVARPRSI